MEKIASAASSIHRNKASKHSIRGTSGTWGGRQREVIIKYYYFLYSSPVQGAQEEKVDGKVRYESPPRAEATGLYLIVYRKDFLDRNLVFDRTGCAKERS